ncbi:hydantoinase/oxoprolinase family protein [Shumkonia mesophila]|uniref:hydantoinase/oxoprolinase family protein n=1 Tax=Shumkonia mesophila TaxID=2838854 RepID=UPI0029349A7C|nr:hydantoinase/oxoprolinase family protein [Shumkonia mesophila]
MSWMIGVDVGGTFTDFFAFDGGSGQIRYWKRPSTPSNPTDAVIAGLRELSAAHGIPLGDVERLCHGSTVATNTLIQRRGAAVSMVTTKGFRDVLEIGRQVRPAIYDFQLDQPEALVPRRHRFELGERTTADGSVRTPVDSEGLGRVIEALRASGTEAVAVCFLFSYLRPDHEREVGDALRRALPGMAISLSSEVQPEFREFERFATTVINAYLQPRLDVYLSSLVDTVKQTVPGARVGINQSSGGLMSLDVARAFPVRMALSGPAAGVVGAIQIAREAERPNIITLDIGGTSADVALIQDYKTELSHGRDVDGFPIMLPMIDITTVGAGGGSIAWFDADGLFKVGPQSAGAEPGPACYCRGGTLPTVSDANLVLGRLSETLLNGEMRLDVEPARRAIATVADPMGKTVEEAALGLLEVMVVNMVRAIRTLSVERGHDPRDFTLMPFGGAGGLHARDVAVALGMREILIPLAPGIVCAQGLADADLQENFVLSSVFPCTSETMENLRERLSALERQAAVWFEAEKTNPTRRQIDFSLDTRFKGQNFELTVDVGTGTGNGDIDIASLPVILERFFAAHERAYGFANLEAPVEIVNCRATARASLGAPRPAKRAITTTRTPMATHTRPVRFSATSTMTTPVFSRDALQPGDAIVGPAIIDQMDATTAIFPGDVARVDAYGNILVTVNQSHA